MKNLKRVLDLDDFIEDGPMKGAIKGFVWTGILGALIAFFVLIANRQEPAPTTPPPRPRYTLPQCVCNPSGFTCGDIRNTRPCTRSMGHHGEHVACGKRTARSRATTHMLEIWDSK